jgi:hypothetical protein
MEVVLITQLRRDSETDHLSEAHPDPRSLDTMQLFSGMICYAAINLLGS